MPNYSQQELDEAREPLRSASDRDNALCVLGHLHTEQRERHSDDRATTIHAITAAVVDFDTRTALGAPAASFDGSGGRPAGAGKVPAPTLPAGAPPAASAPSQATGISAAQASMERTLHWMGLTPQARG